MLEPLSTEMKRKNWRRAICRLLTFMHSSAESALNETNHVNCECARTYTPHACIQNAKLCSAGFWRVGCWVAMATATAFRAAAGANFLRLHRTAFFTSIAMLICGDTSAVNTFLFNLTCRIFYQHQKTEENSTRHVDSFYFFHHVF